VFYIGDKCLRKNVFNNLVFTQTKTKTKTQKRMKVDELINIIRGSKGKYVDVDDDEDYN
jgi:hypothetical protein